MARINIEESIHKDQRFFKLAIKLGSNQNALGAMVWVWIKAQEFWKTGNGIPKPVWQEQECCDAIIEVGLAEDRGDFIYVKGAEKQFAWLRQRSESGRTGGILSGKARREIIEEKTKRNEAKRSGAKPLTLSLSPSLYENNKNTEISSEGSCEAFQAVPSLKNLEMVFLTRKVTTAVQKRWLDAFPDALWIAEQINLALAWEEANPIRRKKNFAAFITRWLTNGWDKRKVSPVVARKGINEILGEK